MDKALVLDVAIAIAYFSIVFFIIEIKKVGFKKAIKISLRFVKNLPGWLRHEAF